MQQASGHPEEVALKRKIATLKLQLAAAKKSIASNESIDDCEGDGPADPAKFNKLKKKAALKLKEVKMIADRLKNTQKQFEKITGAGGAKVEELVKLKEELPKLKDDLKKAKQGIVDRKQEVQNLIKTVNRELQNINHTYVWTKIFLQPSVRLCASKVVATLHVYIYLQVYEFS